MLVREFGARRATRWMGAALTVMVCLAFGPLLVDAHAYLAGPVAMGLGKATGSGGIGASVMIAAATLLVLVWRSTRVRCWADVWMAVSLSLATMVAAVVLARLPLGPHAALTSYESYAYNGMWLILGLVSLVLPLRVPGVRGGALAPASAGQLENG
jgi:uncharacterized membrane protein